MKEKQKTQSYYKRREDILPTGLWETNSGENIYF